MQKRESLTTFFPGCYYDENTIKIMIKRILKVEDFFCYTCFRFLGTTTPDPKRVCETCYQCYCDDCLVGIIRTIESASQRFSESDPTKSLIDPMRCPQCTYNRE